MNLKKTIAALLALGPMLASPMTAAAQGGLAKLAGTARDQSGAAVSGATLTVKNEKTGEERVATADAQGGFTISNLRPSTYTVTATFGAFAPTQYTGILLQAGQDLTLDMELKPGRPQRIGQRRRRCAGDRSELGAHGRERQSAGGR